MEVPRFGLLDLALTHSGRVAVLGFQNAIQQYTASGQVFSQYRSTFDPQQTFQGEAVDLGVDAQDRIVAVTQDQRMLRLRPDGQPDEAFGLEGWRSVAFTLAAGNNEAVTSLVLPTADGQYMMVGDSSGPYTLPPPGFQLARFKGR